MGSFPLFTLLCLLWSPTSSWCRSYGVSSSSSSRRNQFSPPLLSSPLLPRRRAQANQAQQEDQEAATNNTTTSSTTTTANNNNDSNNGSDNIKDKEHKICHVLGGIELTRLTSYRTRRLFQDAIDDLELIREYVTESLYNGGGIVGGLRDAAEMASTFDYAGRNASGQTTVDYGIAYVDDRPDRHMDRRVGVTYTNNGTTAVPTNGSELELAMIDATSNILPWIVDRKSIESEWYVRHQNGRSEGPHIPKLDFDRLYTAVWINTRNDASVYYPPMNRVLGMPYTFGDAIGGNFSFKPLFDLFWTGGPDNGPPTASPIPPGRISFFGPAYSDLVHPGLIMISAYAPIYYTGTFRNTTYDDYLIGVAGSDINVTAISNVLSDLENTLTNKSNNSFAMVVTNERIPETETGAPYRIWTPTIISQHAVGRIYPKRTGMEPQRVVYAADGSGEIVVDRRNATPYLTSDTFAQPINNLTNADWDGLFRTAIEPLEPGQRGYTRFNITLTGDAVPTLFYAMYERWPDVDQEFVILSFAPVRDVDYAVHPVRYEESIYVRTKIMGPGGSGGGSSALDETNLESEALLFNEGNLDIVVTVESVPDWIEMKHSSVPSSPSSSTPHHHQQQQQRMVVGKGENLTLPFAVLTGQLPAGTSTSGVITLRIEDDDYPDCVYNQDMSFTVTVHLQVEENLNQIGTFRILGFVASGIIIATSIGFVLWVRRNNDNVVVGASQPLFLYILCVGTLVMGTSMIPLSIDDSIATDRACSIACMAFPWLFTTGFSITFTALFSKIWRVNKIVAAATSFRRIRIKERDVMVPFVIIFGLNLIILLLWTLIEPLTWTRILTSENESYGTCWANTSSNDDGAVAVKVFVGLLVAVNGSAVILANVQAYRARDISDDFSESKYIGIAMACILQIFLVGIPLLFLVHESPPAFFFIIVSIIFVIAMSMLLLIFVPKFIAANKRFEEGSSAETSSAVFIPGQWAVRRRSSWRMNNNRRQHPASESRETTSTISHEQHPGPSEELAPAAVPIRVPLASESTNVSAATGQMQQERIDHLQERNRWLESRIAYFEARLVKQIAKESELQKQSQSSTVASNSDDDKIHSNPTATPVTRNGAV